MDGIVLETSWFAFSQDQNSAARFFDDLWNFQTRLLGVAGSNCWLRERYARHWRRKPSYAIWTCEQIRVTVRLFGTYKNIMFYRLYGFIPDDYLW